MLLRVRGSLQAMVVLNQRSPWVPFSQPELVAAIASLNATAIVLDGDDRPKGAADDSDVWPDPDAT